MTDTQILWDEGTAYDLFISLEVLFHPADFDVRGVWAAGVRARIPHPQRETLEKSLLLFHLPFSLIYNLHPPKDGNAVLHALRLMKPEERLPALAFQHYWPPEYFNILRTVQDRRAWGENDREEIGAIYRRLAKKEEGKRVPSYQNLGLILDWWANPEEFGESYLEALSIYCEVFFSQEERRIRPALQQALLQAKTYSEELPLTDLLEKLTQGVRFEQLPTEGQVVLAPSFWSTPLVYFDRLDNTRFIYVYGARPTEASLAPGEKVPDGLLRVLKALSDSTRLQILQYLAEQPLSPTQLSHRLRLRVPTVVHHLRVLRLAGLVRLTLGDEAVTKHYTARQEGIQAAYQSLQRYLSSDNPTLTTTTNKVV